jgi:hypothetical protein
MGLTEGKTFFAEGTRSVFLGKKVFGFNGEIYGETGGQVPCSHSGFRKLRG